MKEVAIVAGGSGTIGGAIVENLASKGLETIILDKNEPTVKDSIYYKCDLNNAEELNSIVDKVKKSSPEIKTLVWSAGGAIPEEWAPFEKLSISALEKTIFNNLIAPIQFVQSFYTTLLESTSKDKSILLVSSINANRPFRLPGYSAAKAGLKGFMLGEIKNFSREHIRINLIAPGTVVSQLTLSEKDKDWDGLRKLTAFGEFVNPNDIGSLAAVITFNHSVTGQVFKIDCGQSVL